VRAATPAAPAPSGGKLKWVIGLVALAAVGWLGSQFLGGKPSPVTTATTEAPAARERAGGRRREHRRVRPERLHHTCLDPWLGDGRGLGQRGRGSLTGADATLAGLEATVGGLSGEGRTALSTLIGSACPRSRPPPTGCSATARSARS
jgi:hypothetical protein